MHAANHTNAAVIQQQASVSGDAFSYTCDGSAWLHAQQDRSGTFASNLLPGLLLLVWSLHWAVGVFRTHILSSHHGSYKAKCSFPVPLLPASWPVEAILKVVVPVCAIIFQLFINHRGWTRAQCPDGSKRSGHFFVSHIHEWQNIWMLVGFLAAGVIGLLQDRLRLPESTDQALLGLSFAFEALILSTSYFTDSLDQIMYTLLYLAVAGTAICIIAEVIKPDSFWISCGKVYGLLMQSIWYLAIGRSLYQGRPAWQTVEPLSGAMDMGPAMFVPALYTMWMNVASVALLAVYLVLQAWYGKMTVVESPKKVSTPIQ